MIDTVDLDGPRAPSSVPRPPGHRTDHPSHRLTRRRTDPGVVTRGDPGGDGTCCSVSRGSTATISTAGCSPCRPHVGSAECCGVGQDQGVGVISEQ